MASMPLHTALMFCRPWPRMILPIVFSETPTWAARRRCVHPAALMAWPSLEPSCCECVTVI